MVVAEEAILKSYLRKHDKKLYQFQSGWLEDRHRCTLHGHDSAIRLL